MQFSSPIFTKGHVLTAALVLFLIADIVGFTEYRRMTLRDEMSRINQIDKEGLEHRISDLEAELQIVKEANEAVLGTASDIRNELGDISESVGTLNRLSQTDSELLQKYSKSYFLNEHYVPTELTGINPEFTFGEVLSIHAGIYEHLEELLEDAKDEGLHLGVVSAYRSFGTQTVLKADYKVTYGAGTANQFSAEQGYSEHQLGTAVDFATPETRLTFSGFDKTPEFAWLVNNAHKYGFALSYPKTNVYYVYEPWHWRFVSVDLAKRLYNEGRYFYDYDQREINTYLADFFD